MKAMVVSLPKKIVLLLCIAAFYAAGTYAHDSVNPERNTAVPQGQIEWKPVFPRALFLNKSEISVMETGGLEEYENALLAAEAHKRLAEQANPISHKNIMEKYGISESDLDNIDVELE